MGTMELGFLCPLLPSHVLPLYGHSCRTGVISSLRTEVLLIVVLLVPDHPSPASGVQTPKHLKPLPMQLATHSSITWASLGFLFLGFLVFCSMGSWGVFFRSAESLSDKCLRITQIFRARKPADMATPKAIPMRAYLKSISVPADLSVAST